jgi:DNA-binding NarL/FixJ family response regulator
MAQVTSSPVELPASSAVTVAGGGILRVGIVEDNSGLRRGFLRLVNHAPGMACAGAWAEAESALAQLPSLKPDVVLMDINLPGMSGIECTARLKQLCPKTQVIMVTVYEDADSIFKALQAGACGYMLKRASSEQILDAINEVRNGGAPMTSGIARKVVQAFQKAPVASGDSLELSERETQILELCAQGFVNKEIADRLNISYWTVKNHVKHIYEKLHVRSRSEALMKFVAEKPFPLTPPSPNSH